MKSKIERQVMAGVGVIYAVRKLLSRTALEGYIFIASVFVVSRLVWVSHVFENFFAAERGGVTSVVHYLMVAITHTQLGVQLALLVSAVAFAGLVVDFVRPARQSIQWAA